MSVKKDEGFSLINKLKTGHLNFSGSQCDALKRRSLGVIKQALKDFYNLAGDITMPPTQEQLNEVLAKFDNGRKKNGDLRSKQTRQNFRSRLTLIFRKGVANGLLPEAAIQLKIPKMLLPKRAKTSYSIEQMRNLVKVALGYENKRDALIVLFRYPMGMRTADFAIDKIEDFQDPSYGLRWRDVNLHNRTIKLVATKTARFKEDILPIPNMVWNVISKMPIPDDKNKLVIEVTRDYAIDIINKALDSAGIQRLPNGLRRTAGLHITRYGGNIELAQALLRHNSILTTQGIYVEGQTADEIATGLDKVEWQLLNGEISEIDQAEKLIREAFNRFPELHVKFFNEYVTLQNKPPKITAQA